MDAATAWVVEAARLMFKAGAPWLPVFAMLLLLAAVRVFGPMLPPAPPPTDATDDSPKDPGKPDATWGQNDGPPGGGMEGG